MKELVNIAKEEKARLIWSWRVGYDKKEGRDMSNDKIYRYRERDI